MPNNSDACSSAQRQAQLKAVVHNFSVVVDVTLWLLFRIGPFAGIVFIVRAPGDFERGPRCFQKQMDQLAVTAWWSWLADLSSGELNYLHAKKECCSMGSRQEGEGWELLIMRPIVSSPYRGLDRGALWGLF